MHERPWSRIGPTEDQIAAVLGPVRQGLQKIADDTRLAPDPRGDLTRRMLVALGWNDEFVEAAMGEGQLGSSPRFVVRGVLPEGVHFPQDLPPPLKEKVAFDTVAGQLTCFGALRESERDALLNVGYDPHSSEYRVYAAAVQQLYALSRRDLDQKISFVTRSMQSFELPFFQAPLEFTADLAITSARHRLSRLAPGRVAGPCFARSGGREAPHQGLDVGHGADEAHRSGA